MNRLFIAVAAIVVVVSAQSAVALDTIGKKLYEDNCMRCHGDSGQGAVGKRLAGDAAYWDFAIFKRAVMTGIDDEDRHLKNMPVWGRTGLDKPKGKIPTDEELQDLQWYLKTFGPPE